MYALSTYHLQQGVEKATKGLLLSSGLIPQGDVIKIRHDSLQGHNILAQKILGYFRGLNEYGNKIAVVLANLNLLKQKNKEEVARYDYEIIVALLTLLDLTVKKDSAFAMEVLKRTRDREYLKAKGIELGYGGPELEEAIEKIISFFSDEERAGRVEGAGAYLPTLFIASAVTYPHWSFTRYSDGPIKPRDYTLEMGIVRATPELVRRVEEAIVFISKL